MRAPDADLARVAAAHDRLLTALVPLGDAEVRRASRLPGWSVAHVLTHLARNADSHVRRAAAAVRGEMVDQYEGGTEGRAAEIEAGSARPAAELRADVERSARAVEVAWRALAPEAWAARSRDSSGHVRCCFELPARRWQEVEIHLVDLDVGVTWRDWSDEFVEAWLARSRERLWGRYPAWVSERFESPAEELAWLTGRHARQDLPAPPAWG